MNKTLQDYEASISILRANIEFFKAGNKHVYRVIATELRKLMCDGKLSLLPRVFKDIKLHRLHISKLLLDCPSLADGLEHMMPGRLEIKDGRATFRLLFANTKEQIPLEGWINQPLFTSRITVWELIKSVADREAAHSDPKFNTTLEQSRSFLYNKEYSYVLTVVAVGEYLLDFLRIEKPEMIALGESA